MAITNPLSTPQEVRNEFADIRHDGVIPLVEAIVAMNNGQAIPDDVKTKLQALAERLYAARVADAAQKEEETPDRPAYLDPA